jgi:hypothetical protein
MSYEDEINDFIIQRELAKDYRDSLPNGFHRNEATKEVSRWQTSIMYRIIILRKRVIDKYLDDYT